MHTRECVNISSEARHILTVQVRKNLKISSDCCILCQRTISAKTMNP